ncbi:hypothetical protein BACPEC_02676 [[Bacteroides] pectinophilus ATCC 43243]|uniref:Uncharacterized protein n=1 Tax=[Bacteroides] pectinophilus ATCC 43243 TaxID=483218 RepID=B7AVC8_9FIRM|nr:hypothetical protein BACPEC_02676 [[Bacteroides] pectinophilus ATCC 43243]
MIIENLKNLKFTLKSDYALNIIAIDKPPKYELKDTSYSTEKSSLFFQRFTAVDVKAI